MFARSSDSNTTECQVQGTVDRANHLLETLGGTYL